MKDEEVQLKKIETSPSGTHQVEWGSQWGRGKRRGCKWYSGSYKLKCISLTDVVIIGTVHQVGLRTCDNRYSTCVPVQLLLIIKL